MPANQGTSPSLPFAAILINAVPVVVSLAEKIDGHPPRRITLDDRNDFCLLGRASRKGTEILARPDNGYFENPVVSRNHAEIRADFLYEVGSSFPSSSLYPTLTLDIANLYQGYRLYTRHLCEQRPHSGHCSPSYPERRQYHPRGRNQKPRSWA